MPLKPAATARSVVMKKALPEANRPAVTLEDVLAELRELRRVVDDLAARHGPRMPFSAADVALVAAIHEAVGPRPFCSWQLIDHAELQVSAALAEAIVDAIGALNARKLGKLLRRIEGQDVQGLRAERVAASREGLVWRVTAAGLRE